jgi:hypothetical protein
MPTETIPAWLLPEEAKAALDDSLYDNITIENGCGYCDAQAVYDLDLVLADVVPHILAAIVARLEERAELQESRAGDQRREHIRRICEIRGRECRAIIADLKGE